MFVCCNGSENNIVKVLHNRNIIAIFVTMLQSFLNMCIEDKIQDNVQYKLIGLDQVVDATGLYSFIQSARSKHIDDVNIAKMVRVITGDGQMIPLMKY